MLTFFSRVIRLFLVVTMMGVTVVAAGAALAPNIADLKNAVDGEAAFEVTLAALDTRSELYDKDGNLIHRFSTDGSNRELLTLADMPEQLITSVVTVEDEEFWEHPGVNLRATFRALVENVGAGGISQGGSTISQQLVKQQVLEDDDPSIPRKIREAVISWRMEELLTKEEILEAYLNSVYFGEGAYGVQAAAEVYFGKDAQDLDWPETAMLASLISSPATYNPFLNPGEALRQRSIVFNRLVEVGAIDREEARFYNRVPLPEKSNTITDVPPEDYYVAEVRRRFLDGDLIANQDPLVIDAVGETRQERIDALFRGGLRIFTTYDRAAQAEAERARDEVVPELPEGDDREFTMAIAAIEPESGAVRALVGGPEFQDRKFNLATQGDRQPGSSFKTFVLVAALEAGYIPQDTISGVGPCLFDNPGAVDPIYEVINFGNSTGGVDTLTNQVTRSSNCAFVRLGQVIGIPEVIETAIRLGVNLDPETDNNLSLPLGATEVRPLEVASAYATLANGGVRHEPFYIERIEDSQGNVIYERAPSGNRVLAADVACQATQVLEQNVIRGTGTRAQVVDQPAGGKTGTTENFSDAWFVGFTPQLATAVWMGNPEARVEMENVGGRNVTGGSFPAEAWGQFMNAYHLDLERQEFPTCSGTRAGRFIRDDGELSTQNPCAAYPGYAPTDTTGDGNVDQCIVNPTLYGYVRCGAIQTEDDEILEQFCAPGSPGARGAGAGVRCNPGFQPVDLDGDGRADTCANLNQAGQQGGPGGQQGGQSGLCDVGYEPRDTNGDGRIDVCLYTGQNTQPPPPSDPNNPCPAEFPYGRDTTGDGRVDTCFSQP
ncbi:MAG: transglycosylase domain-containing protein [Actinomycetota bacterium]